MRALRSLPALSLVAVVAAAPPADAQVKIGVAGLYASLGGDDFQGTDAGLGGDAQVRFALSPTFTLGGGVQFTSHDNNFADGNINVLGVFAEPRYHIAMSGAGALRPYLAARAERLSLGAAVFHHEDSLGPGYSGALHGRPSGEPRNGAITARNVVLSIGFST
jgi:hypothetical protein